MLVPPAFARRGGLELLQPLGAHLPEAHDKPSCRLAGAPRQGFSDADQQVPEPGAAGARIHDRRHRATTADALPRGAVAGGRHPRSLIHAPAALLALHFASQRIERGVELVLVRHEGSVSRTAPRVQCDRCDAVIARSSLNRHQAGMRCKVGTMTKQAHLEAERNREMIGRLGFEILPIEPDLRPIFHAAGLQVIWTPVVVTRMPSLSKRPHGPAWAVRAAIALVMDGHPSEHVVRLLQGGEHSVALVEAVALAALASA